MHCPRVGPIPSAPLKNENWSWRVKAAYLYLWDEAKVGRDPWQQLAILKRAIVDTTWSIQEEITRSNSFSKAAENDDKVGWTMRMVRAIERSNWSSIGKYYQEDNAKRNSLFGESLLVCDWMRFPESYSSLHLN